MRRALRSFAAPLAALLASAACGGARPVVVSAPVPEAASALSCAMGKAAALGYVPVDGGLAAGHVSMRVQASESWTAGDVGKEVAMRYFSLGTVGKKRLEALHLDIVGAGDLLKITAAAIRNRQWADPTPLVIEHAQSILAACSTKTEPAGF